MTRGWWMAGWATLWLGGCPGPTGPSITLLDDDSADDDDADDDAGDDDIDDDDDDTGDDDDSADDDDDSDCDVHVPSDVGDVGDALAQALDGDVICVDPGLYPANLSFDGREVVLRGRAGATSTVLDGGGLDAVVRFDHWEGPGAVLEGFTLINGRADEGGGIHVRGADPTLRGLVVMDNEAEADGGGIYLESSAAALSDLQVRANTAGDDGGGLHLVASTATLAGLEVVGNHAADLGGGLCLHDGAPDLDGLLVALNASDNDGGGLALVASDPTAIHLLVVDNAAAEDGGGIHAEDSEPTIVCAALLGNWAGNDGGALAAFGGQAVLVNTAVVGNLAGDDGGGAYLDGGALTVSGATLVGNTASSHGGAISCEGDATLAIDHSDLFDNAPSAVHGADDPVGSWGNVAVDPQWLDADDPDPLRWDLHLHAVSPLVDAGSAAILDPDGGRSDPGMFGGPYADSWDRDRDGYRSWWTPGPYDAEEHAELDCDDGDPDVFPGEGC